MDYSTVQGMVQEQQDRYQALSEPIDIAPVESPATCNGCRFFERLGNTRLGICIREQKNFYPVALATDEACDGYTNDRYEADF